MLAHRQPGGGVTDVARLTRLGDGLLGDGEVQTLDHGGHGQGAQGSIEHLAHVAPGVDLGVCGRGRVELVLQLPGSPGERGGDGAGLGSALVSSS